ncbi:MAG: ABC transporter substrate-binding protein [Acetobacteraceae bacterium]
MAGRDDYLKSFADAGGSILAQEASQFGQTDFRPALLKIADAKPEVMLVVITAGLQQMAQQYKQLDLKFTVAGTTFFSDPPTIADPSSAGFIHTQLKIDAPPDLADQFKAKYGTDMEFFAKQYYNAAQIILATLDKVLAENKRVTGESMHDALFEIRKFQGLIPLEFKTNTASVPININIMRDGKDVLLKEMEPQ